MVARLVSWNVNGIRSCARKGFLGWLRQARADVVALQETRAELGDLPAEVARLRRFPHASWSAARSRRGYSGVALLSRVAPLRVSTSLGREEYDREGRFLVAELPALLVASVYFPKGSGNHRDNSRVPFKLAFTEQVFAHLERERRDTGKPVVLMGDLNIAPEPIDLARPRENLRTSGFLPEERELLARCTGHLWADTYRALHPGRAQYTWWSQRLGVRAKNIGWRIDHVLVSRGLLPRVRRAFVSDHVRGSDHCPVGIDLAVDLGREPSST